MEELLKIAYRNFLDCYDENNSKEIRIINTKDLISYMTY